MHAYGFGSSVRRPTCLLSSLAGAGRLGVRCSGDPTHRACPGELVGNSARGLRYPSAFANALVAEIASACRDGRPALCLGGAHVHPRVDGWPPHRYVRARRAFAGWCRDYGVDVTVWNCDDLDVFVARFILFVKEDDDTTLTRQSCLYLMATAQRRASAKLTLSQQVLRLWQREAPPRQAEAMPSCVAYAMVVVLSQVRRCRVAALHVLLAFSACLRIGESLSLRRCDVVIPRAESAGQCVLILRATKRGFDQRVVVGNSIVVNMIRDFLKAEDHTDGMTLLAPCSYSQFARAFGTGVRLLSCRGPVGTPTAFAEGAPQPLWRWGGRSRT